MITFEVVVDVSEGAKGGAKSVMNRRRKQRTRGGVSAGGNNGEDGDNDGNVNF